MTMHPTGLASARARRLRLHERSDELTPSFRTNVIVGRQLVIADWNRFNPTKAVNRYHQGVTELPKANDEYPRFSLVSNKAPRRHYRHASFSRLQLSAR